MQVYDGGRIRNYLFSVFPPTTSSWPICVCMHTYTQTRASFTLWTPISRHRSEEEGVFSVSRFYGAESFASPRWIGQILDCSIGTTVLALMFCNPGIYYWWNQILGWWLTCLWIVKVYEHCCVGNVSLTTLLVC